MTGPVSPTGPPTTAGHSVLVVPIPALETLVRPGTRTTTATTSRLIRPSRMPT